MKILSISDGSYFRNISSMSGTIIMLGSTRSNKVIPIHWELKTIHQICTSTKDAEPCDLNNTMSYRMYAARRIEQMLFGHVENRS